MAITSAQSGLWSAATTWVGGNIPGTPGYTAQDVIIAVGHQVEIDVDTLITLLGGSILEFGSSPANQTTLALDIRIGSSVKWQTNPGANFTVKCKGNVSIDYNAVLEIGSAANPIPAARTATWYFPSSGVYTWLVKLGSNLRSQGGGAFRINGAPAYHMADAAKQRCRLASDRALGSPVTITVDANVDWQAGDVLWIGCGGSQTTTVQDASNVLLANYGQEQVTIISQVAVNQYSVNLVYNHLAGDMVVHATRNVIVKADATQGWAIRKVKREPDDEFSHGGLDLNWARVEKMAGANLVYGIEFDLSGAGYEASDMGKMLAGDYKIKNCVFDTPGHATGITASWLINAVACANIRVKAEDITMVHTWGWAGILRNPSNTSSFGKWRFGDLTCMNWSNTTTGYAVMRLYFIQLQAKSLWSCWTRPGTGSIYVIHTSCGFKIDQFLMHYGPTPINHYVASKGYTSEIYVGSGEVFNAFGGNGSGFSLDLAYTRIRLRNLKWAHCIGGMVSLANSTQGMTPHTDIYNCSFDNGMGSTFYGAIQIGSAGGRGLIRIRKCTFGTNIQNKGRNIVLASTMVSNSAFRVVISDCDFKVPSTMATYDAAWGVYRASIVNYLSGGSTFYTLDVNRNFSLEIVRPISRDASGVNQWNATYPGVTYMALVGGGCELRNEGTVVVDGTLGLKLMPWNATMINAGTYRNAIDIPAKSGKQITVKVKLRKNVAMSADYRRPRAHMRGLNLDVVAIMTDVTDTWEEQTLVGTPSMNGFVKFWVEPGCNTITLATTYGDTTPGTVLVYADAFSVTQAA